MIKNSENEILNIQPAEFLMKFMSHGVRKQSPELYTKVIDDACQLSNVEADLSALEAEFQVIKDLHRAYNPRWVYTSNLGKDNKALFIEEVIEQMGGFYGAIAKLEKELAQLEGALEHQEASFNQLVIF